MGTSPIPRLEAASGQLLRGEVLDPAGTCAGNLHMRRAAIPRTRCVPKKHHAHDCPGICPRIDPPPRPKRRVAQELRVLDPCEHSDVRSKSVHDCPSYLLCRWRRNPAVSAGAKLLCASIGITGCSMGLTSLLTFPVPFYMVVISPVSSVIQFISFRIVVGARVLRQMLQHRDQWLRFLNFASVQTTMVFVYPAYEALFRAAQGTRYQVPVIFILPLMKVGLKNTMLRFTAHMEDMAPEAVIFTVDFFNALYLATCMQSATSITAVAAITVTDFMQTAAVLYGLNNRTATILPRLQEALDLSVPCDNLLSGIAVLCRDLGKFEQQMRSDIRVRSCLAHKLSVMNEDLISKLDKVPLMVKAGPPFLATGRRFPCLSCRKHKSNSILPIHLGMNVVPNAAWAEKSQDVRGSSLSLSKILPNHSTILRETLEMLFTTECLILTAFLEAVIPFFYCSYILVMVHLPSAGYHSEMVGINRENAGSNVLPVFVFGLLQVTSFMALSRIIKRNCRIGAPHQLAFVLETQLPLVTSKLMFWAVVTLCFRVEHFGVDFTFKFKWN